MATSSAMHMNEHPVSPMRARYLIAAQMPDLIGLPLRRVGTGGTDNVMYRLGPNLLLRFPRLADAVEGLQKEVAWLPYLAPSLSLACPEPVAMGEPGDGYPFPWVVLRWLPGRDALAAPPREGMVETLVAFLHNLQRLPQPQEAPISSFADFARNDDFLRKMIAVFPDAALRPRLTAIWEECLALSASAMPPVWTHGDLHSLNLLTQRGRLSGVIDWGRLGVGCRSVDLICAWALLDVPDRARLKRALAVDDTLWARGRALAFAKAVMAIPYYQTSNLRLRTAMEQMLTRVLDDFG